MVIRNFKHTIRRTKYQTMTNIETQVAKEILDILNRIWFSDEYRTFRLNHGIKGQRDLILKIIKEKYGLK